MFPAPPGHSPMDKRLSDFPEEKLLPVLSLFFRSFLIYSFIKNLINFPAAEAMLPDWIFQCSVRIFPVVPAHLPGYSTFYRGLSRTTPTREGISGPIQRLTAISEYVMERK